MTQYIDKTTVVTEIEKLKNEYLKHCKDKFYAEWSCGTLDNILSFLDTLEVIDPYEQCIQYASIEDGIKTHAEVYAFNVPSKLFNQLSEEQRILWRNEIEQACISGGDAGVELARDIRYKENIEAKKVDLEKEIKKYKKDNIRGYCGPGVEETAKYFFELGLKAQKGE